MCAFVICQHFVDKLSYQPPHLDEVWKKTLPIPGRVWSAKLSPSIVLLLRAAKHHLTIDTGAAAYATSNANREASVVEPGVGLRGDVEHASRIHAGLLVCYTDQLHSSRLHTALLTEDAIFDDKDAV